MGAASLTSRAHSPVLVVDDDEDHRCTLATALNEGGFETVEAANGESAIAYLLQNPEPGAIVLDLFMPGLSGWDVLRVLRSYKRLQRIPVIVTSGEPAWVQAPGSNVVARLRKPYRLKELFTLLDQHLGDYEPSVG